MSGIELNVPAFEPGAVMAATDGYVIRWNGQRRTADVYTLDAWNARVATLAAGGVVLDHGPVASVEVCEWDWQIGAPANDVDLRYFDKVDLLDVLERWIGGQS